MVAGSGGSCVTRNDQNLEHLYCYFQELLFPACQRNGWLICVSGYPSFTMDGYKLPRDREEETINFLHYQVRVKMV